MIRINTIDAFSVRVTSSENGGITVFNITKQSPDRLDIELFGTLNTDDMRLGLDELIEQSEDIKNGKMLYKIKDFTMPTIGAIGVEFTRLSKLFGLLGKFDKCAVLSDASWIRTAAEIEGAIFPGIEIKSFPLDDVKAAEDWLAA
ncbi:MAG: STAS/SEC14 domain-containing protein [Cognatishimia sp.]